MNLYVFLLALHVKKNMKNFGSKYPSVEFTRMIFEGLIVMIVRFLMIEDRFA